MLVEAGNGREGAEKTQTFFKNVLICLWDSSVGIATRYGLDGTGIESRWGARFSAPVHTGPGAHPASCTMSPGFFPGVKRPGRGVDHPSTSSAEVKERVELYLYSPFWHSWPVLGRALPLPLLICLKMRFLSARKRRNSTK